MANAQTMIRQVVRILMLLVTEVDVMVAGLPGDAPP